MTHTLARGLFLPILAILAFFVSAPSALAQLQGSYTATGTVTNPSHTHAEPSASLGGITVDGVTRNGVVLNPGTDYILTGSGSQTGVRLLVPLAAGDVIVITGSSGSSGHNPSGVRFTS